MPKYKQPRLKITTIRNGRICKRYISARPPLMNQQTSTFVPALADNMYYVEEQPPQAKPDNTQANTDVRPNKNGAEGRESWDKIKKSLRMAFFEGIIPEQCGQCVMCHQEPETIVTCRECSRTGHVFCKDCAIAVHKQHFLLHTIVEWENGRPYAISYQCTFSRENHDCPSSFTRSINVFNDMGHLHTALITYCSCEAPAVTLVRFGLWPCSPKMPATAVSMELMDIVYCMMMEGQISLKAVCQAIGNHSCLDPNEVNLLYRCMVGECMEQFRFFRHMIRTLGDVEQEINCMECPACPQNGPVFISLDANFGLVRKKSSGQSYHPPNHATDLFVGDDEVHTFVEEYDGNAHVRQEQSNKDCSNFQAGNAVRTKNQSNKLDITGVFGAACRHGIPLLFLNMKHGERFAYPVMAIHKLLERMPKDTAIIILYDIACKLDAHLKKRGTDGEEILRRLTSLTVPVFHAYGHKRSCQISYGAKWTHGVGLTDGEIMERIWAFLRKFSHITKEMTPSHRIDLLTDALYYFTKKKLDEMDIYLRVKIDNALKVETEASVQLTAITQQCKASVDDVKAWREAEKTSVGQVAKSSGSTALTWEEKYVKELLEYDTLRNQLQLCSDAQRVSTLNSTCDRMQSALIRTEKVNKIPERWKADDAKFIASNKSRQNKEKQEMLSNLHRKACDHSYAVACSKRYSAGQTLAARLTRQMKATSSSIHKAVKAYNESNFTSGELPDFITYKDVIDPESQIYDTIQGSGLMSIQKNAVDLLNKIERAKEEQQLLIKEMHQFLLSLRNKHTALSKWLVSTSDMQDHHVRQRGMKHLIMVRLMVIEGQHDRALSSFGKYVTGVKELRGSYLDISTNCFFPRRCDVDTHEDVLADFQRELEQLDGGNEENEGEIEVADDDCFDDDPQ